MLTARIIGSVSVLIILNLLWQSLDYCLHILRSGVKINHQGADFCAQKMIGARGSKRRQLLQLMGVYKFKHFWTVIEMSDHMLAFANQASDSWHDLGGHSAPFHRRQALMHGAPKGRLAICLAFKPIHGLLDDFQRQTIAGFRIIIPSEQTMAFQNDTARVWIF